MNPYQPPAHDEFPFQDADAPKSRLATRGQRFGAAWIDGMISIVILLPAEWKAGMFDGYPRHMKAQTPGVTALWALFGFVVWFILHSYFLIRNAQTIGKRLVGIRIEDFATGKRAEFSKLVFLRYLPLNLVSVIPKVGVVFPLIDALLIFRRDHRCVHDHIAGTVVVKVEKS
jgi:uncharacterized RDD family membrane protein YckC